MCVRVSVRARFNLRKGPILTFPGPKCWSLTNLLLHPRVIIRDFGVKDEVGGKWVRPVGVLHTPGNVQQKQFFKV